MRGVASCGSGSTGATPDARVASASTTAIFFRTYQIGVGADKVQFAPSDRRSNSPLTFVPAFVPDRRFSGATVGDPNTPRDRQWAIVSSLEPGARSIVNRATETCADIEEDRERTPAVDPDGRDPMGARVVLRTCDGTKSQRWKVVTASGNSTHFVNLFTNLVFTQTGDAITLQPFQKRLTGQLYGSTFVQVVAG
ncbi:hypothetical protein GCM10029976_042170 [Kribbella albertanoniae]